MQALKILRETSTQDKTMDDYEWYKLMEFEDLSEKEGKKEAQIEIAKRLLEKGLTDDDIKQVTNLSVEEIKSLRNEMQKSHKKKK